MQKIKLTKKEAKELSIKKWEYIVENDGGYPYDLTTAIPELKQLLHHCGYCQKYKFTSGITLDECQKCPIRPKIKDYNDFEKPGCCQNDHVFEKWYRLDTSQALHFAQELLELIKNS